MKLKSINRLQIVELINLSDDKIKQGLSNDRIIHLKISPANIADASHSHEKSVNPLHTTTSQHPFYVIPLVLPINTPFQCHRLTLYSINTKLFYGIFS